MRRRILLADDSVTIQKVIELTFMDEDYEVRAVSNGDEAIKALFEVDPDVVIADVHMPGANGYEVCRHCKEARPAMPVLLLVGTFEPFDEAQARAAGADSFLKKPFDSQELLQRVAALLAAQGAPRQAQASQAYMPPVPPMPELPPLSELPATYEEMPIEAAVPSYTMPPGFAYEPAPEPEPEPFAPIDMPAPPAPITPVEEWRGFELSPEPEPSFALDDTIAPDWDAAASLPADDSVFELEEELPAPAPAAPAAPALSADEDVFSFEPEPAQPYAAADAAPLSFEPQPEPSAPNAPNAPVEGTPFAGVDQLEPFPAASSPYQDSYPEPYPSPYKDALDDIETPFPLSAAPAALPPPPAEPAPIPWAEPAPIRFEPEPEPMPAAVEPPASFELPVAVPEETVPEEGPAPEDLELAAAAEAPAAPTAPPAETESTPIAAAHSGSLSDADIERVARRVVELLADRSMREVAWEVIPDLAEVVIRDRLRELESQAESLE